jgi:hypothetical protein
MRKASRHMQRLVILRLLALLVVLALSGGAVASAADVLGNAHGLATDQSEANRARVTEGANAGDADCGRRKRPVRVRISPRRWPAIARHIRFVHRTGQWPRVWNIDRLGAEENRDQAIDHWEATKGHLYDEKEREGKDREEAPPAVAREGGLFRGRYAHVRLVDSGENRSAGAYLGNKLEPWCDGQRFVLVGR